jgi:hypothetical protein
MNAATHADAVIVRPAALGDAGRIGELITELGYPTDGTTITGRLAPILSDPHYLTLVAGLNGLIVGVAAGTCEPDFDSSRRWRERSQLLSPERRGPPHPVGWPLEACERHALRRRRPRGCAGNDDAITWLQAPDERECGIGRTLDAPSLPVPTFDGHP